MKIQWKFCAALCLVLTFALASFAQTTAAPAVPAPAPATSVPLTAAERETALNSLQSTHDAFLKSIAGLSERQWRFKPAPDRWSVAEVSEHIAVSESTIFGLVQKQIMAGPGKPRDG